MGNERLDCEFVESYSERFITTGEGYKSQYYLRSVSKLQSLKKLLLETIKTRWTNVKIDDSDPEAYKLVESINYVKGKCVVIGTIFKQMKNHPSPLDEYIQKFDIKVEQRLEYTDDDDYLFLEDHTQRLVLVGNCLNPHKFVSGLVIAVRGYMNDENKFVTEDYILPEVPDTLALYNIKDEEKFIALTSGLELSGKDLNYKSLLLLQNFILGECNSEYNKRLVRLVVAGNGIGRCDIESLERSDIFYAQLASSVNVDLMPGTTDRPMDPTNSNLPQQVINPILMENSKRYGTFRSTTNPYFFSIDGLVIWKGVSSTQFIIDQVRFLGVSGQTVEDMCKFSRLSELDALKLIARSRCIAPTGTDSLPIHSEMDVFNLTEDSEYPHVFFTGNCKEYEVGDFGTSGTTKLPKLVCVPSFRREPTLVLISLRTLEVTALKLT
ncbi:DNA polymerase delta small subunit, putative [Theileria annulata]|uniref:DNA polymerase delta small subunit, putative n=1 Tax=Theileria annulata TaxID=5874 RepID=Q4UEH2_THEAN|nr:DNA polymerase delta small subunit, putative [Theileria annulata]CAI74517.1 DNA polymerase delta small subunit, putative [Theileria annulata]|eukprot:XP_952249.1 DNA polymerase delta small subunit, putative [Theileria annulata]